MVHRAYSVLQLKSIDDDLRVIEGVATTPEPDRGRLTAVRIDRHLHGRHWWLDLHPQWR